jgi:hypothetical protein
MGSPTTWITLAGTALGAKGQIDQGNADKRTGETNARLAEAQANDALLRGTIEESRYRRQIAQVIGGQKAAFGKRNVAVSGTALDLLSDTAAIGEEDAQTIRNNAARTAWGYKHQANESSRWGANSRSNSQYAAAGTLLTGGAQAYGQWADK